MCCSVQETVGRLETVRMLVFEVVIGGLEGEGGRIVVGVAVGLLDKILRIRGFVLRHALSLKHLS